MNRRSFLIRKRTAEKRNTMPYRILTIVMLLAVLPMTLAARGAEEADATGCEEGFRVFEDARGEVCVPDAAQRIVSTHDYNSAVQLLSLGAPIVGMASRNDEFTPDVTQYFDVGNLTDVGNYRSPNLEIILELEPDLISTYVIPRGGVAFLDEDALATLESIAPVVAIDPFRPVEEVMADYTELLGAAATVSLAEQQAEFARLLGQIESALGDDARDITVGFISFNPSSGAFQAWGPTALVPLDILTRTGVNWVPIQLTAEREHNGHMGDISLETINEFSADIIMIDTFHGAAVLDIPVVQQLPAIDAGQVILLDRPIAGSHYANYIALAQVILEELNAIEDLDPDLVFTDES